MEPEEPRGRTAVHRAPDRDRQFPSRVQRAVARRSDVRLIPAEDMNTAASRQPMPTGRAPFSFAG